MFSHLFCFQKDRKPNKVRFLFFILMKEFKSEFLKKININFMVIFTSMVSLSPLRFSAVIGSRGHQESAAYETADAF